MFDFGLGSSELLLVAIIALIVIGPKDLPRLLRTMGQYMRKIQGMAREFQNHLNEAAKEAGVDDVKKEVKGMTNFTVTADLDKQGAQIKKAIESGAPKPVNGGKAEAKAEAKADAKTEPTRIEAGKSPPKPETQKAGTQKAGTEKAGTEKAGTKAAPKKAAPSKAAPSKAAPKKAAPKATPKSAAARKSPAKPQTKSQSRPKAARAAEAVKS